MKALLAFVAALLATSVAVDLPPWGPTWTPPVHASGRLCDPPESLTQAYDALARLLPPETVRLFARGTEDDARRDSLHLGMFVREFWNLWRGGPFRRHLIKLGVRHPDDMSQLVLVTWWRVLNDRPPAVDAEVQRVRSAERWRPDPRCQCLLRGPCVPQNYIRQTEGGLRAFAITGCCCGQIPQVAEGKLVQTKDFTFVFRQSSTIPEYNQACLGTSFADVVEGRTGRAAR
jgi:hypothetical protein